MSGSGLAGGRRVPWEHEIGSSNLSSPTKVCEEMAMTAELISMKCVEDRLTTDDDLGAWREILDVLSEEFLERYRANGAKKPWFLRIGTCSHWWRPHQARWTARGGFAAPVGYSENGWPGLPELDWSVTFSFNGGFWERVEKSSGSKQVVLRVAIPARTARHKQAAIHTVWSSSRKPIFYGFRNVGGRWLCVAASDERKHGRMLRAFEQIPQG